MLIPAGARSGCCSSPRSASATTRVGRHGLPSAPWRALAVAVDRCLGLACMRDADAAGARLSAARSRPRRCDLMGYLGGFAVTLAGAVRRRRSPSSTRRRSAPKPDRLHGRHVLNRYEDGMEKCIGCELCAGVCPARCIYVRGADNPPDDRSRPASATASSTRSTTCAASTATCASRPARPRPSPRRSCSSSPSPTAQTPSTPRTSCWSTTTAGPSGCRGRTGGRRRGRHLALGAGHRARRATPPTRAGSRGRASSASVSSRAAAGGRPRPEPSRCRTRAPNA